MPFMSLRLQTTGNELSELNKKMNDLIQSIELTSFKFEEEDLRKDSLNHMKADLKEQKQHDHEKLIRIWPNFEDLLKSMETIEIAKFINKTRVVIILTI